MPSNVCRKQPFKSLHTEIIHGNSNSIAWAIFTSKTKQIFWVQWITQMLEALGTEKLISMFFSFYHCSCTISFYVWNLQPIGDIDYWLSLYFYALFFWFRSIFGWGKGGGGGGGVGNQFLSISLLWLNGIYICTLCQSSKLFEEPSIMELWNV